MLAKLVSALPRGAENTCCQSTQLHAWDPAAHLRLIDPTDFRTLDRF